MGEEKKEEKLELVDFEKIRENRILGDMIEAGLITKQGFRIQGMGLVLKKLDELKALQDKTNLKLWKLENAVRGKPEPQH